MSRSESVDSEEVAASKPLSDVRTKPLNYTRAPGIIIDGPKSMPIAPISVDEVTV